MSADEVTIRPVKAGEEASQPHDVEQMKQEDIAEIDSRSFFFRHVTAVVKTCAIFLIAGMWVCAVFLIRKRKDKDYSPWYCLDDGGCCCTCWRIIMWLDNWKKGFLYIAIAVPAFINFRNLISVVCGVLMVAVGLLYIVKSCADCRCVGGRKYVRRKRRGDRKKKSQTDEETPALAPSGDADER